MTQKDEGSLRSQASGEVVADLDPVRELVVQRLRAKWDWAFTTPEGLLNSAIEAIDALKPVLDILSWLHAEAVWQYDQAVEDWSRNDEQVLAENQRLADENELLREELDKVSGGWSARVDSRAALRTQLAAATLRADTHQERADRLVIGLRRLLDEDREIENGPAPEPPVGTFLREEGADVPWSVHRRSDGWVCIKTGCQNCPMVWGEVLDFFKNLRPVAVQHESATPPEASSEASPLIHLVTLSSDTGVMGEWQAFCHGCRERQTGDLSRVAFWKDQHEADTLVPSFEQEAKK